MGCLAMSKKIAKKLRKALRDDVVVTVPLAKLIKTIDTSVDVAPWNDEHWFAMAIQEKIMDDQMGYLIDSLLRYGFVCPINVNYANGGFQMGNGHHRLIAAAFCGIEEVPVKMYVPYSTPGDCCDWNNTERDSPDGNYTNYQVLQELYEAYEFGIHEILESL